MSTTVPQASSGEVMYELPPEDRPRVEHLVTEDDTPVDNIASAKQQRLLTEPLYSSWSGPGAGRNFLVCSNVGLFYSVRKPPLVPDVFLSLDVEPPPEWWAKQHRSYFYWEYGKPPEVVIEVVSNREGEEAGRKLESYAQIGILYYVIWDPAHEISDQELRVYVLRDKSYVSLPDTWLPLVGLGLVIWTGTFENSREVWLRWSDASGNVIPTGAERAERERQRAEHEHARAEHEHERAEQQLSRIQKLEARLRELGGDPENA